MALHIYSVEQLMCLRPRKPGVSEGPLRPKLSQRERLYFHLWGKYIQLLKRGPNRLVKPGTHYEYKYDYFMSNRAFKAQWVRTHGSLKGLKDVPRRRVLSFDRTVTFLQTYVSELRSLLRRIDNLRPKLHINRSKATSSGRPAVSQSRPQRPERRAPLRNDRTDPTRVGNIVLDNKLGHVGQYLGGRAVPFPPKPEWKKYWYFKRKNGFYTFSEHHPYGDEGDFIRSQTT